MQHKIQLISCCLYFISCGSQFDISPLLLRTADEDIPLADETIVAQLTSMGFNHLHCQKAAINTSNTGVEEAMNWLFAHMEDPGILMLNIIIFIWQEASVLLNIIDSLYICSNRCLI